MYYGVALMRKLGVLVRWVLVLAVAVVVAAVLWGERAPVRGRLAPEQAGPGSAPKQGRATLRTGAGLWRLVLLEVGPFVLAALLMASVPVGSGLWVETQRMEGKISTGAFGPLAARVEIQPESLSLDVEAAPGPAPTEAPTPTPSPAPTPTPSPAPPPRPSAAAHPQPSADAPAQPSADAPAQPSADAHAQPSADAHAQPSADAHA